jgi:hypothetical protein
LLQQLQHDQGGWGSGSGSWHACNHCLIGS